MNYLVLFMVLAYEVLSIGVVGYILNKKQAELGGEKDLALGGRSLGTWAVGSSLVLIMLGSGHTTGTFEGAYSLGISQIWYLIAHGFLLVLVVLTTGVWARRMRITSIGDALNLMYGEKMAILAAATNIIVGIVVTSCETQAMAICINGITGLNLNVAVYISGAIGLFYIIIGGLNQNAKLNQFNIIVMYGGLILALIWIAKGLPGGNFDTVKSYYLENNLQNMLSFTGENGFIWKVALPSMLTPIFCHATGQSMLQSCAAAKNEKVIKRSALFVGPLNSIVGCISITLALTAKSMAEYRDLPAKTYTIRMLMDRLPNWLIALVLAALVAALLSSIAGFVMSSATILTNDYIKGIFRPNMTPKQTTTCIRVCLVLCIIVSTLLAQFLPPIIVLFVWLYSFLIPIFFLYYMGLWWKRSEKVAVISCVVPWLLACLWTFTSLPQVLHMEEIHQFYVIAVSSFAILTVGNLLVKGQRGYFHSEEWKNSEAYRIHMQEKAEGGV